MNYRLATILAPETHEADTTKVIDIDIKDPISQIQVIYKSRNTGQANGTAHPVRCITKIEIIDGSEVLYSLSGAEAQAADWYHNKREPLTHMLYLNDNWSQQVMNINFGRYLWDTALALDPTKFSNLQMKISIAIAAGGSLPDAGVLIVLAHIFDEKSITPEGFLMHKEIKSYTLANGSHEYTDLPVDFPYRKLFVRAQRYGYGPEAQVDIIKLSEDVDKKVPLNHNVQQILQVITGLTRPYREWIIGPGAATAKNFYCTPTHWPALSGSPWRSASLTTGLVFYEGDGGRFQTSQAAAGPNWQVLVEGWAPHGVIAIPFGLQNEIADWYDVAKIGNLKLDITAGGAVGDNQTAEIFLQQLRKY